MYKRQVLKAYDGEEALKVLKDQEVDLLVIDVMMPRLDAVSYTHLQQVEERWKVRNGIKEIDEWNPAYRDSDK